MLSDVVRFLRCPHCGCRLAQANRALRCEAGHTFDIARQGYVSLLPADAGAGRGDTGPMVAARERFLAAGHLRPLAEAIAEQAVAALEDSRVVPTAEKAPPAAAPAPGRDGLIVDVGAGTGHHLARLLDALPDRVGLAIDSSKYALRRAARAHPRIGAVAADAWRALPVRAGVAAVVLSVFAPRDGGEIARVLAPDGALIAVTPTAAHLAGLVSALDLLRVDEGKPERLDEKLAPALVLHDRRALEWELRLTQDDAEDAAAMGPSAWHADPAALAQAVAALPEPLVTTAAVTISVYRRPAPTAEDRV